MLSCSSLRCILTVIVIFKISTSAVQARSFAQPSVQGWKTIKLNLAKGSRDGYLLVPSTYRKAKLSPVVVLLHGAGKDAQQAVQMLSAQDMALLASQQALLLVPESRGATWDIVTRSNVGQDLLYISSALRFMYQSGYSNIDPKRMGLVGFSDGATYALAVGISTGSPFSHVIAFSPGGLVSPQRVAAGPKVFISHGTADTLFPIDFTSRRIVPQLQQTLPGREVHYVEFSGDHVVPAGVSKQALQWLLLGTPVRSSSTRLDERGR